VGFGQEREDEGTIFGQVSNGGGEQSSAGLGTV
jgi:hypothetical protein